ncbi:MAG: hypothetical protein KBE09_01890 [Candidatus Pacebacteria bacterium]|nr:hypothetical protein [Candidatus Paceibacterota bacterium]
MNTAERATPQELMTNAALIALKRGDELDEVKTSLLAVAQLEHVDPAAVEHAISDAQALLAQQTGAPAISH